jgi:uncharacterized protein YjiK
MPLLETHVLSLTEPSDLAIDETGTILWTVTKSPVRVRQLDLQGNVTKTLSYVGEDLEGVAYDPSNKTLWIAEEEKREVIHLDLSGVVLGKCALALTGQPNQGLEGICLDDSGTVFVLNQRHPGLFIRLKPDRVLLPAPHDSLVIASELGLGFAGDYNGMTYDAQQKSFWITSDMSQKLYRWTPNRVLAQYPMSFGKPEGVAYDPVRHRVYVVSQVTSTLYVFDYSTAAASAPGP